MAIPQFIISMLLFFVLFFGGGFLLNMILRTTWVMAIGYPIIVTLIVYNMTNASFSVTSILQKFAALKPADIVILTTGLVGAILSGIVIRSLREKGYRMF